MDSTDELYAQILRYAGLSESGISLKAAPQQALGGISGKPIALCWTERAKEWAPVFRAPGDALESKSVAATPAHTYWYWFSKSLAERVGAALAERNSSPAVFSAPTLESTAETCLNMLGVSLTERDMAHLDELMKGKKPQDVMSKIIALRDAPVPKAAGNAKGGQKKESKKGEKASPKSSPKASPKSKPAAKPKPEPKKKDKKSADGPFSVGKFARVDKDAAKVRKESQKLDEEDQKRAADMAGLAGKIVEVDDADGTIKLEFADGKGVWFGPKCLAADKGPAEKKLDPAAERKAQLKKVVKEGGKRGVEIEGAADMGGLQFFCTSVDEPKGDLEFLGESMKAMNAKSDPTEEERKGGSGHIGKMLFSAGDAQLAVLAYLPEAKKGELDCKEWMAHVMKMIGGKVVSSTAFGAEGIVKTDSNKGIFPLKVKEPGIMEAINYLKGKGLFPDHDSDDDEMVFGDDDFPE